MFNMSSVEKTQNRKTHKTLDLFALDRILIVYVSSCRENVLVSIFDKLFSKVRKTRNKVFSIINKEENFGKQIVKSIRYDVESSCYYYIQFLK